jgi:hypothetical protein
MLLKNRAGATSFEDLRTVEGEMHGNFKGVCIALGLCVDDDSQWIEAMNEAVDVATPFVIRQLFATILLECHPTDPKAIFDQFSDAMGGDYVHKRSGALNLTAGTINNLALDDLLKALNTIFEDYGKMTNESFGIEMPDNASDDIEEIFDEAEFDPDAEAFFQVNYSYCSTMTNATSLIHSKLTLIVVKEGCTILMLLVPGGSGKTLLKDDTVALAMALSGIAATLLKLGTTFHRRFGVPFPCLSDSS